MAEFVVFVTFFGSLLLRLETCCIHTLQKDLFSDVNCMDWISDLQTGDKIKKAMLVGKMILLVFFFKSIFFLSQNQCKNYILRLCKRRMIYHHF